MTEQASPSELSDDELRRRIGDWDADFDIRVTLLEEARRRWLGPLPSESDAEHEVNFVLLDMFEFEAVRRGLMLGDASRSRPRRALADLSNEALMVWLDHLAPSDEE